MVNKWFFLRDNKNKVSSRGLNGSTLPFSQKRCCKVKGGKKKKQENDLYSVRT